MRRLICTLILSSIPILALASQPHRLTEKDIDRLRTIKAMTAEVDHKSLEESLKEIEVSKYPSLNLEMKEAMAHAYADIVHEQNVHGLKNKEWLYSMIALNMAYLQFGGTDSSGAATDKEALNRLIRYKLKTYLPPNIRTQPGFKHSLG